MSELISPYSDAIMTLIEHELHLLPNEKQRIECLARIKDKLIARYEYEVSDPLEELSKALDDMSDRAPDDVKCIANVYELLKKKEWVKAVRLYEKADTFVREFMPKKTYVWMYTNFEKVRH